MRENIQGESALMLAGSVRAQLTSVRRAEYMKSQLRIPQAEVPTLCTGTSSATALHCC